MAPSSLNSPTSERARLGPALDSVQRDRLDALVIGAQKCATSWLYYCLRDHPQLHLPKKKREVEYLGGALYQERGADWYFALLAGAAAGQKVCDVSVDYLFDPKAPRAVRAHAPDVKLIVSLRDPVDRAVSAYYWNVRKGSIPDRPLDDGLRRAAQLWSDEAVAPAAAPAHEDEYLVNIIARGCYDVQLERYLDVFPPEHLLAIEYERIAAEPRAVLRDVYAFIGVDPIGFEPPSLRSRPKQNSYAEWLLRLERLAPRSRPLIHVMDWANRLLNRLRASREASPLSPDVREQLEALFAGSEARTQDLVERTRRARSH